MFDENEDSLAYPILLFFYYITKWWVMKLNFTTDFFSDIVANQKYIFFFSKVNLIKPVDSDSYNKKFGTE